MLTCFSLFSSFHSSFFALFYLRLISLGLLSCLSTSSPSVKHHPFSLRSSPNPKISYASIRNNPNSRSFRRYSFSTFVSNPFFYLPSSLASLFPSRLPSFPSLPFQKNFSSGKKKLTMFSLTCFSFDSDCSSASRGGDLGPFARGQMQKPFEDSTFGLKVGEMSGVVETDSGMHAILRTG